MLAPFAVYMHTLTIILLAYRYTPNSLTRQDILCGAGHSVIKVKKHKEINMARIVLSTLFGIVAISLICQAQNTADTLVLVDNLAIRETHSIFFKNLHGT